MAKQLQQTDIADVPELIRLANEVVASRSARLLTSGDRPLALLTPAGARPRTRRARPTREPDSILNIIGIGASAEPTDIGSNKQQHVAEAYESDLS